MQPRGVMGENCFSGGHVTSAWLNGRIFFIFGRVRVWDRVRVRVQFGVLVSFRVWARVRVWI